MNKLEQLRWVNHIFQNNDCPIWFRAGTLLGLIRENSVLPWDDDIDIGIWNENLESIEPILKKLKTHRFFILRKYYKNKFFGFDIRPQNQKFPLKIEIAAFRRADNWAWAPAIKLYTNSNEKTSSEKKIGLITNLARKVWQFSKKKLLPQDISLTYTKFPTNKFFQIGTWAVPLKFYENLKSINIANTTFTVPENHEEYLNYRYGDWQQPKKEWDYWEDDQTLKKDNPEDLIKINV